MFHPKETERSIINNRPFQNCIISKRESLRYFCYEAATAAFVQKVAEAKNDPEGGKIMTMAEYYNRQIPEYYPTMYMDGYEPYQILHALRRKMIRDYEQREEAKRKAKEEADNVVIPTINFNTSIKVK